MSNRKPAPKTVLFAAALLLCSCSRNPEYPPPVQIVLPSGPEPAITSLSADRMVVAMADPNVNSHIVQDVFEAPDGAEWRFTGLHPKLRLQIDNPSNLDFYLRFAMQDESLKSRGPVSFSVGINGHKFQSYRFALPGDFEYRHPIPPDWLQAPGPVDISLDIDPAWRTPDGTVYGLLLHSIGFERRSP